MRFSTVVELGGKTATGLVVPAEVVEALGAGRKPAVRITVGGHTYRSTVAARGGRYLVPLSAENRAAAGVSAGDEVTVEIEVDDAPREVTLPDDLAVALNTDARARAAFEELPYTRRKEHVRAIDDAKRPETRLRRIERVIADLKES